MSIRMGHNIRVRTVRAVAVIAVAATAFIGIGQPAHAKGATLLADTFSGGGLNLGNWTYLLGEYPTDSQIYLPTEVLVDGGGLHLHAEQPKPFTVNLAGGIESQQSFLYGEFHVVARLPKDDGLWPAAWLSAQKNGEIDIFEAFGSHTTRFQTTVHDWNNGSEDGPQCIQVGWKVQPVNGVGSRCSSWIPLDKHGQPIDWHADFHDWGMLWTPSGTSFTMDGHPYWSTSWSPSVPMKLVLNVGVGTYWDGYPDGTDVWPASMDIRSVTVNALQ